MYAIRSYYAAAKKGGIEALENLGIEINRPIKMMLSQISPDIDADIREMKEAAIEWKFDGTRVQIHKSGNSVTLFSRKLENVTNSLPDLVEIVRRITSYNVCYTKLLRLPQGGQGPERPGAHRAPVFRRCTSSAETAAGRMPRIRCACPRERGRTASRT